MATMTLSAPNTSVVNHSGNVDNRATYLSFALAYVFGHGAAALSKGSDPVLSLPGWLPMALLGAGLAAGTVFATLAALRAQRDADGPDVLSGKLLGVSWGSAFAALFLIITGITSLLDRPDLQGVLWPVGSGLIVGLLYLGEGAARRNVLHYCLGTWLALVSTGALLLGTPNLFWVLTLGGGGGYAIATILERRRLAALR